MTVTVEKGKALGEIYAPPSKSLAHRGLICAALSNGCRISNIEYSNDIKATLSCLKALGADVRAEKDTVFIGGLDPRMVKDGAVLDCLESGSTLRFMIPLCLLTNKRITLKGSARLFERPLSVYEDICNKQGLFYEKTANSVTVCGKFKAGEYFVKGDISSQFISGLLFALPLLEKDSKITLTGNIESRSYINLTLNTLKTFGIDIDFTENTLWIKGKQHYSALDYTVEGDCSNASFLDAFNLLGGKVSVLGLNDQTVQGDFVYKTMFSALEHGERLFDLSDCPDLAPIMFALAAAYGGAEFVGTKRLKIKESDRAQAMKQELSKFGINLDVFDNKVIVENGTLKNPTQTLFSHNDHRIAMALSVLCTVTGGTIECAEAVNKSYPDFFQKLKTLKIGIKQNEA